MQVIAYRWTRSDGAIFLIDPGEIEFVIDTRDPNDPGPVTPSPVPGPVAASTSGSTNQHPTENRDIA